MFTLTSAAAQQIHQAARDSGAENLALRVAARLETDGSIDYGMGFDDAGEQDMRLQFDEVAVVIAEHHRELLEDTVLDFVELEPGQFNFIFVNQRQEAQDAPGSCAPQGCGSGGCGSGGGCGSKGTSH
jgi:iron-sulfur cluster assembly protein